jgi:hypothetical protein
MLGRLQPSLLQRYSLRCLESKIHTACALTQAAAVGPTTDSHPQQKSRQSPGGQNRQRANPGRDGPQSDKLQRPNWGGPRSSDGPARGGGSLRQQRGGGGGGQRNNYQGGPRRPQHQHGGGGKQDMIEAALGSQRSGPLTGAAAIMQVNNF